MEFGKATKKQRLNNGGARISAFDDDDEFLEILNKSKQDVIEVQQQIKPNKLNDTFQEVMEMIDPLKSDMSHDFIKGLILFCVFFEQKFDLK